jgi:hypothetical protein
MKPPFVAGGGQTRRAERGDGGSIFWKTREIGLPSYNDLSTGYPHHTITAGGGKEHERNIPCTSILLVVERDTPCASILQVVEMYTHSWASSLKGHGNEADFLGFLQKLGPHRSLTLPFEPFRFWL